MQGRGCARSIDGRSCFDADCSGRCLLRSAMTMTTRIAFGILVWAAGPLAAHAAEPDRLFREQVAPILEKRCVHCHGAEMPKGGLSLATRAGLLKGGENGPAVVPGKPEREPAAGDGLGRRTPVDAPEGQAAVAGAGRWPASMGRAGGALARGAGAAGPAVRRADVVGVPAAEPAADARGPRPGLGPHADRRVHPRPARGEGLAPSPEADRRTLIRRLTFDLHGLPPTPEEIDAFVDDHAPDAYEKLVDRLLASPRYGERWGRHWLDVVHYGDTHGYDKDKRRAHAWPYRDYVIRALQRGQALRPVRPRAGGRRRALSRRPARHRSPPGSSRPARGTSSATSSCARARVDKQKTRLLDRDDMVREHHDHLRQPDRPLRPLPRPQVRPDPAREITTGSRPSSPASTAAIGPTTPARSTPPRRSRSATPRPPSPAASAIARKIDAIDEPGSRPARRQIDGDRGSSLIAARRSLAMPTQPEQRLPPAIHRPPDVTKWVQVDLGRSCRSTRSVWSRPARSTSPTRPASASRPLPRRDLRRPEISPRPTQSLADDVRPTPETPATSRSRPRRRPDGRYVRVTATWLWKRPNDYLFALAELEVISRGDKRRTRRRGDGARLDRGGPLGPRADLVDGFDSRRASPARPIPRAARRHRAALRANRKLERARRRRRRPDDPTLEPIATAAAPNWRRRRAASGRSPRQPWSMPCAQAPRPISVLRRGDVEQPGEPVGPGHLSCVPGLDPDFSLADPRTKGAAAPPWPNGSPVPKNPLTWRSIVNRVWQYHFGRGIVDTPNDFGRNGSRRPIPNCSTGWPTSSATAESLKTLHRLIVTSATYRQSSRDDAGLRRDRRRQPLLWRMNRRRLDAEAVRDTVLAVSGKLDLTMGGPGFELFRYKDDKSPVYDHTAPEASTTRRTGAGRSIASGPQRARTRSSNASTAPIPASTRRCATRRSRPCRAWPCSTIRSCSAVGALRRPAQVR